MLLVNDLLRINRTSLESIFVLPTPPHDRTADIIVKGVAAIGEEVNDPIKREKNLKNVYELTMPHVYVHQSFA